MSSYNEKFRVDATYEETDRLIMVYVYAVPRDDFPYRGIYTESLKSEIINIDRDKETGRILGVELIVVKDQER